MKRSILKIIPGAILTLGIAFTAGCTTTAPTLNTAPDAEVTFDGLTEVKNSKMDQAWARSDLDLSGYSKIIVESAGIAYRPDGETRKNSMAVSTAKYFEVTDGQKARLQATVDEAFLKELGMSERFTIVTEPGPDVLLIKGALVDVVSYVPPEPASRGGVFLRNVGDATLVLEVSDSITEAVLVRVVDRRSAEFAGRQMRWSNRVNNMSEVRRLAAAWASRLRMALDNFEGWDAN